MFIYLFINIYLPFQIVECRLAKSSFLYGGIDII